MEKVYQVIVEYHDPRAGAWHGPVENGDAARERYGTESLRIARGGIRAVYLTRHGVVVAMARH